MNKKKAKKKKSLRGLISNLVFLKHIDSKRQTRKKIGLLLGEDAHLTNRDTEQRYSILPLPQSPILMTGSGGPQAA